jgi:hypothetical protein
MPFELGLAVAWQKFGERRHLWYVFEAERYRAERTLSDIAGTDPYIHGGKIEGVLRESRRATFTEMVRVYRLTRKALPAILKKSGSESIFDGAQGFRDVCLSAADFASTVIR